jgi:general secretion pathway protein K
MMLVMMVIFVLAVIVGEFAYSMAVEVRLARNTDYDEQLEWMGRSGVELARYALVMKCPQQQNIDALNQFWAGGTAPCSNAMPEISLKDVPMGAGKFSVTIVDMERKWDLNLVANSALPPMAPAPPGGGPNGAPIPPPQGGVGQPGGPGGVPPGGPIPPPGPGVQMEVMQRALNEIGVTDASQASTIIESIVDWISRGGEPHFNGAKTDYYQRLSPPYYCKNGNIDDLSELLLVKGVTPEIYWGSNSTNHPVSAYQQHEGGFTQPTASTRGPMHNNEQPVYPVGLHDLFSPMGGRLNINTASVQALQLIPGIDESTAQQIVHQRAGPDGIDGTEDDLPFQNPGELNSANLQGGIAPGIQASQLARYCDVRSYVFEVHVDAEINGYKRTFIGIVSRGGMSAQATKCVKFYWN